MKDDIETISTHTNFIFVGILSVRANMEPDISIKGRHSRQILSVVPGCGQIMIWPVTI